MAYCKAHRHFGETLRELFLPTQIFIIGKSGAGKSNLVVDLIMDLAQYCKYLKGTHSNRFTVKQLWPNMFNRVYWLCTDRVTFNHFQGEHAPLRKWTDYVSAVCVNPRQFYFENVRQTSKESFEAMVVKLVDDLRTETDESSIDRYRPDIIVYDDIPKQKSCTNILKQQANVNTNHHGFVQVYITHEYSPGQNADFTFGPQNCSILGIHVDKLATFHLYLQFFDKLICNVTENRILVRDHQFCYLNPALVKKYTQYTADDILFYLFIKYPKPRSGTAIDIYVVTKQKKKLWLASVDYDHTISILNQT